MREIETDYLVVGAGAAGMAFVDALISACDADVVLDEQLLASGRVRFFGMSEWVSTSPGRHRLVSRLTGDSTTVRVRRRVVDARYLEPSIPATHVPSFDVEPGVRLIPVNDLVTLDRPASGFTVIGAARPRSTRACGCWSAPR